jgi:hypothetical protein
MEIPYFHGVSRAAHLWYNFFTEIIMETYAKYALEHICYLTETIGGRGSCTAEARRAGEYIHQELEKLGVSQVAYESFEGRPSTYRPFVAAFSAALAGSLLGLFLGDRWALGVGALLNLLGGWAMFAETEFKPNWTRWFSPKAFTRNVTGMISPSGEVKGRVVLCAHYDTHRTPVFYSSAGWQRLFGVLVSGAFMSMVAGAVLFGLGTLSGWVGLRWVGVLLGLWQMFVLVMVASADFTPFSPGANDNASGIGAILGLVKRLNEEPLKHMQVSLVFTDCEETGAHGMIAYLSQHMQTLGEEAVYIVLDEVGTGRVKYITNDGLVIKHKTHPRALALERQAAARLERGAIELPGTAYNDVLPATLRGRIGVTVCSADPEHTFTGSHWHQMSDRVEYIDLECLKDALTFTWYILEVVDGEAS